MRVDFEIGAFKFMYVGNEGNEDKALALFMQMTDQVGKILSPEIVQSLVAADPAVIEAIKRSNDQRFRAKNSMSKSLLQSIILLRNIIVVRTAEEATTDFHTRIGG